MLTLVYTHHAIAELDLQMETFKKHKLEVEVLKTDGMESDEAMQLLAKGDVIMMGAHQPLTAAMLTKLPKLKMVSVTGVGFDKVDIAAVSARGIWVSNTPDYGMDEVSNHAVMMLLVLARGFAETNVAVSHGTWDPLVIRPLHRLAGQTVGIIGLGRIGKTAGRKLRGLGLKVIAYDPHIPSWEFAYGEATSVSLETLLRHSDYISLHAPHNAETDQIINHDSLGLMKPSACLINTARGGLVDESALLDALNNGKIRAAGLDVLTIEPPPMAHPVLGALLKHPRAYITPHIAYYSEEGLRDMQIKTAENIVAWARDGKPNTPVNHPKFGQD